MYCRYERKILTNDSQTADNNKQQKQNSHDAAYSDEHPLGIKHI